MCWEGIHDSSWDYRVERAKACYEFISANANSTIITNWVTKDGYLTEAEIFNNAVMLYRYFSAGGGGGGLLSKRKTKLPLYMMIRYFLNVSRETIL